MRSLLSLCALLVLLSTGHAAVFRSPNVKHLTTRTFKNAVHSCGYCKKLAPEYDRVADSLKGIINVVSVDCDADENKPLCGEMGIQGFPTIKMFPGGSAPPRNYDGPRETRDMIAAATGNMPTFVKRAGTAAEVAELREKARPSLLQLESCRKVTPLYKALSTDFHRSIDFYAARDTKVGEEAMKGFGVEKTPALLVLHGGDVSMYDGPLKYDSLHKFLADFAGKKHGHKVKKTHDDL
ncbi:hypothetical protein Rt10032_c03g1558 [Rhodotorula toruloides]|uniref:Thioredoxin domain-containing protein n=1 Tax=Rhodotorula toruloides TaxID=5286 RepID=A0A511KB14_RHOTO|nr:hypothetical protein Rt10032_c03g1558 [Rhodotorula toruloides]